MVNLEDIVIEYKNYVKHHSGFKNFLQECAFYEGVITQLSKNKKINNPYTYLNMFGKNGIRKEFKAKYYQGINKIKNGK